MVYGQKKINVTVIGGHKVGAKHRRIAYELGKLIAQEGWVLVCGGKEGVMEAACQGAKSAGGLTIGIMPSLDASEVNKFVDVALPTGLGYARNILVARASRFVVAVSGEYGTLSEIAFAFNDPGRMVIGIDSWKIPGMIQVKTAKEAVNKIKKILRSQLSV
jgi:uncharacterized protein (TIGR00725 family)